MTEDPILLHYEAHTCTHRPVSTIRHLCLVEFILFRAKTSDTIPAFPTSTLERGEKVLLSLHNSASGCTYHWHHFQRNFVKTHHLDNMESALRFRPVGSRITTAKLLPLPVILIPRDISSSSDLNVIQSMLSLCLRLNISCSNNHIINTMTAQRSFPIPHFRLTCRSGPTRSKAPTTYIHSLLA